MTLIPILERLFIRDLICRESAGGGRSKAVREDAQVRLEKKNHAR
jgi:hypothetical protein